MQFPITHFRLSITFSTVLKVHIERLAPHCRQFQKIHQRQKRKQSTTTLLVASASFSMLQKNALDAVATACVFALPSGTSISSLCSRLGLSCKNKLFQRAVERAKRMIETSSLFVPNTRAKRHDCYRDEGFACVHEYLHSDTDVGTRCNINSKRVFSVEDKETGNDILHPMRIWNDVTWTKRYKTEVHCII
jgi:RNase P protein component